MPRKIVKPIEGASKSKSVEKKNSKPATKAIKKVEKVNGKKAVVKKEIEKKAPKAKSSDKQRLLELGLLLDCTSSMASWIERAKKTL